MRARDAIPFLRKVKRVPRGWTACCPAHDDDHPSLSITEGPDRDLFYCHAGCSYEQVRSAIETLLPIGALERANISAKASGRNGNGKQELVRTPVAEYDYQDVTGNLLYKVVRKAVAYKDGTSKKEFHVKRRPRAGETPSGDGWVHSTDGVPLVLYRLPELAKAQLVYLVEGEKDVETLRSLGLVATCNPFGARKWRPEYNESLRGRTVVIIPDNDDPGRKHAIHVAGSLLGVAKEIVVVDLPGLKEKGDVTDFIEGGGTLDDLMDLVSRTPAWRTPAKQAQAKEPLPANFQLIESGDNTGVYFVDDDGDRSFVCGPIKVLAETHSETGENYGRLLEWTDSKGRTKVWAMPIELVHSDGTDLIKRLSSLGLKVGTSRKQYERLRTYINLSEPEWTVICTTRTGWHSDGFVLPDEFIGGSDVAFQTESVGAHKFNVKGTIEEWREQVAKYAAGNSRLTFAISAGFAAPLLRIVDVPGGGIHFRGGSSTGKTTLLQAAGSVWGGSDDPAGYCQTWRATANGLESVCEAHNDALLCLDEIGECDSRQVGDVAYMISNGQGKNRMTKTIMARRSSSWQLLFLSSGEQSLADKMQEAGLRIRGGQEIRLADVDADTGMHGIFEDIHGFADAQAFADHLRAASKTYYGTAIREFLRKLTKHDRERIRSKWKKFHDEFVECLLSGHTRVTSEMRRLATRFALIASAGQIATNFGITGWSEGEALEAAKKIFEVWAAGRKGSGTTDSENAISQVRAFLEAHGQSRFQSIGNGIGETERVANRVGFKRVNLRDDTTVFLVLPESFRLEICKGFDPTFVAKVLKSCGFLITDAGKNQKTERLPELGNKKVYAISSRIFDEDSDGSPDATEGGRKRVTEGAEANALILNDLGCSTDRE